jgi:hypothetical protein
VLEDAGHVTANNDSPSLMFLFSLIFRGARVRHGLFYATIHSWSSQHSPEGFDPSPESSQLSPEGCDPSTMVLAAPSRRIRPFAHGPRSSLPKESTLHQSPHSSPPKDSTLHQSPRSTLPKDSTLRRTALRTQTKVPTLADGLHMVATKWFGDCSSIARLCDEVRPVLTDYGFTGGITSEGFASPLVRPDRSEGTYCSHPPGRFQKRKAP